jgi:hypothetical protein
LNNFPFFGGNREAVMLDRSEASGAGVNQAQRLKYFPVSLEDLTFL